MRATAELPLAKAKQSCCGPATYCYECNQAHLEDEEVQQEEDESPDEWTQLQAHDPAQAPLLAQQGALSLQAVALLGQVDPQEPARVARAPLSGGRAKQGCPAGDSTASRQL